MTNVARVEQLDTADDRHYVPWLDFRAGYDPDSVLNDDRKRLVEGLEIGFECRYDYAIDTMRASVAVGFQAIHNGVMRRAYVDKGPRKHDPVTEAPVLPEFDITVQHVNGHEIDASRHLGGVALPRIVVGRRPYVKLQLEYLTRQELSVSDEWPTMPGIGPIKDGSLYYRLP